MKFFSFLFGMICLLESTMMPACIQINGIVENISISKEASCCVEQKDACDSQINSDDCASACSPFQHCGCCKPAVNGVLTFNFVLPQTFDNIGASKQSDCHAWLPESYLSLNDPPPKFS